MLHEGRSVREQGMKITKTGVLAHISRHANNIFWIKL
jgi:hypothetical protein